MAVFAARELEQHIYASARQCNELKRALVATAGDRAQAERVAYADTCRRISNALHMNARELVRAHGADLTILTELDDAALGIGTSFEADAQRRAAAARRVQRVLDACDKPVAVIAAITAATARASSGGGGGASFVSCSFCGSKDVDTDTKQRRSLDEPADLHVKCNTCGKRRRFAG